MQVLKDFNLGLSTYGQALKFISRHKMGKYFIVPIMFSIVIAFGMYFLVDGLRDLAHEWLNGYTAGLGDSTFENILKKVINFSIAFLSFIIFIVLYNYIVKFVVLILMSPILSYVSEQTEKIITGNDYPFEWKQFMKDIIRGIKIAIANMFKELAFTILLLVLHVVPLIGSALYTACVALIAWYYFGYSTLDYVNERRRLSVAESNKYIKSVKGLAVGNGMVLALALYVPFLGFIFMPIISTVAATLAMHEKVDLNTNTHAKKVEI